MATKNKDPFESLPTIKKQEVHEPHSDQMAKDPFESLPSISHEPEQSTEQAPNAEFNELESAGLGAVQGGTLGYADEIEGAVRGAGAKLAGQDKDLVELYKQYRDSARNRYKTAENENPKSFMTGNIGAGIATSLVPGLGEANLAKLTALGAATGLGTSEADLTEGDLKGAAIDTGVGGATGYILGKAGEKIGKALTPEATQTRATARAVKALGEKALPENLPMGKAVLDEGLLPIMGGSKATQQAITGRMSDLEKNIVQPTLNAVSQNSGLESVVKNQVPIRDIVTELAEQAKTMVPQSSVAGAGKRAIDKASRYWISQLETAAGDPKKLNELRKLIDAEAKQAGAFGSNPDLRPKADFLAKLRDEVNNQLRTISGEVSTGAGNQLEQAMGRQSALYGAKDAADKLVEKDIIHPPGSILDAIKNPLTNPRALGVGLAAMSNPLVKTGVAGTLAAEKITQQPISRLGNIISARTQNSLAKGLDTGIGKAAVQGVEKFTSKGLSSSGVQSGIQSIYSVNDDRLRQVADKFSQQDNTKYIAQSLTDAIDSGNEDAKNKIIFAMEQRPDIRAQLREMVDMQQENTSLLEDEIPNG